MITRIPMESGTSTTTIRSIPARTPAATIVPVIRAQASAKRTGVYDPVNASNETSAPVTENVR